MGVEQLFLKAETLYLVEVLAGVERHNIVRGHPNDGLVSGVAGSIEGQGSLSGVDLRWEKDGLTRGDEVECRSIYFITVLQWILAKLILPFLLLCFDLTLQLDCS